MEIATKRIWKERPPTILGGAFPISQLIAFKTQIELGEKLWRGNTQGQRLNSK